MSVRKAGLVQYAMYDSVIDDVLLTDTVTMGHVSADEDGMDVTALSVRRRHSLLRISFHRAPVYRKILGLLGPSPHMGAKCGR